MKFTIDTNAKFIEISFAGINEIETIKKGIEAMGLDPNEFVIVTPTAPSYSSQPYVLETSTYPIGTTISN